MFLFEKGTAAIFVLGTIFRLYGTDRILSVVRCFGLKNTNFFTGFVPSILR